MLCKECGSDQFEEENGLLYCCFCQTQCQGFTQESAQDFVSTSKHLAKEVTKKRVKRIIKQKTGVLWTTTEAFNLILYKQMNNILDINSETINRKDMHQMMRLIWFSYLRKSGLAFTDGEVEDTQVITRKLHPASRFRDIQILTNKVDNSLPAFKNGSTDSGFCQLFKLGSDGVIRTTKELQSFTEYQSQRTEEQNSYELLDVYYDRYNDPRNYADIRPNKTKISKESQKKLRDLLSKMSSELSLEQLDNYDEEMTIEDSGSQTDHSIDQIDEDLSDHQIDGSITSSDSLDNFDETYDKELKKNLTETTKLFSKHIPLSYMKKSRNISSDYFIDLMSLPKTLAFLNIVCRLLCYDIFTFDLIRWANEEHIPYNNCLTCFPEDWLLIPNDFHTFTSHFVPSLRTISTLSTKIAKHIGIRSFPMPDFNPLFVRLVKDLNLPKDLVHLIDSNYCLLDNFRKELNSIITKRTEKELRLPHYEKWVLMAIILVLKRVFILNDSSERRLSESVENHKSYFIWNKWENYTRLRVELIRSYFIPSYVGDLEDIRDPDLIADHYLHRSETQPTLGLNKNALYKRYEFKSGAQKLFNEFMLDQTEDQSTPPLKPSLYPLTNATNFALNRIKSVSVKQKLSIDFGDKLITPWTCSHSKVFHRGYVFLSKDRNEWSQSFKLLIYLSCFILNCRVDSLIPILNCIEKKYFSK